MRLLTAISLIFGSAAVGLALAPAPDPADRPATARLTVAEADLIERLRDMAEPKPIADEIVVAALPPRATPDPAQFASLRQTASRPVVPPSVEAEAGPDASHVVLAEALNVRSSPSNGAGVVGRLLAGQSVNVADQNGGWYYVTDGGIEGWAYSRYLAPVSQQ